jgi:hypothetical protein
MPGEISRRFLPNRSDVQKAGQMLQNPLQGLLMG